MNSRFITGHIFDEETAQKAADAINEVFAQPGHTFAIAEPFQVSGKSAKGAWDVAITSISPVSPTVPLRALEEAKIIQQPYPLSLYPAPPVTGSRFARKTENPTAATFENQPAPSAWSQFNKE